MLTEVTHLLDFSVQAQIDFLNWVQAGGVQLHPIERVDLVRICQLTRKYADLPMNFADATLMRIAEKEQISQVISIDRDFYIYRKQDRLPLENLFTR